MSNNPGYNPCPQCGSGADAIRCDLRGGLWRTRCTTCGAQTHWYPGAQRAFDAWQLGEVAAAASPPVQTPALARSS